MTHRMLIIRLDGIGDALALTPLIAALREAGHRLGIALSDRNAEIFETKAFLWKHVLTRNPWPAHGSTKSSLSTALSEARSVGYEIALIASEEPEAYELARTLGIRQRVGFVNGWEKPFKTLWARGRLTRSIVRPASARRVGEHEVVTLFRLGDELHGETRPTTFVERLSPLIVSHPRPSELILVQWTPKLAGAGFDVERATARCARSGRGATCASSPRRVISATRAPSRKPPTSGTTSPREPRRGKRPWPAPRVSSPSTPGAAHVAGMTERSVHRSLPGHANGRQRYRAMAAVGRAVARARPRSADARAFRRRGARSIRRAPSEDARFAVSGAALMLCTGGGIGDVLLATPVMAALRARYERVVALTAPAHLEVSASQSRRA